MEIRFFVMNESRNTINKNLGDYTTTFLKLKSQDVDVINPILTLKFLEYPKFNYLHIPALSRYYFIDDIFIRTNNTYELHCLVDVLQSFKDDILKAKGYIKTSTSANSYLDDNSYSELENYECDVIEINCDFDLSQQSIVLTTIGGW